MYSRKQLAKKVLDTLRQGPASLEPNYPFGPLTKEQYDLWAESWLIPQLVVLVPELANDPANVDLFNSGRELLNRRPMRKQTIEQRMMDDGEIAAGVQ